MREPAAGKTVTGAHGDDLRSAVELPKVLSSRASTTTLRMGSHPDSSLQNALVSAPKRDLKEVSGHECRRFHAIQLLCTNDSILHLPFEL